MATANGPGIARCTGLPELSRVPGYVSSKNRQDGDPAPSAARLPHLQQSTW